MEMVEVFKRRMNLCGIRSQRRLSDLIGGTYAQLCIFFNNKGNIDRYEIDRANKVLGIDLGLYIKRYDLAYKVAEKFIELRISEKGVLGLTKDQISVISGQKEVMLFFDVSKRDYKRIIKSGLIDIESTFQFFKAMVMFLVASNLRFN